MGIILRPCHAIVRLDPELRELLEHRYGDGLVYLREPADREILARAERMGFVTPEGYLTAVGRAALDCCGDP